MKPFVLCTLVCTLLLTLCACQPLEREDTSGAAGEEELSTGQLQTSIDENGKVYYSFDDVSQSSQDKGKLVERVMSEPELSVPEGSISPEEAIQKLDHCIPADFQLAESISAYQKLRGEVTEISGIPCYSFSFYAEKAGVNLFVGQTAYVACDGRRIFAKTILGNRKEVFPSETEASVPLPEGAAISPTEALLVLADYDPEELNLTHGFLPYNFEIQSKLFDMKSKSFYRIIPRLTYEHSTEYSSAILVSADGQKTVYIQDKTTGEYVERS